MISRNCTLALSSKNIPSNQASRIVSSLIKSKLGFFQTSSTSLSLAKRPHTNSLNALTCYSSNCSLRANINTWTKSIAKTALYLQQHATPVFGDELSKAEYINTFSLAGGRSATEAITEIAGAKLRHEIYTCTLPQGYPVIKFTSRNFSAPDLAQNPSAGGFVALSAQDSPASLGLNPNGQYHCYIAIANKDVPVIIEKCATINDWMNQSVINPGGAYALRVPRGSFTLKYKVENDLTSTKSYAAQPEDMHLNKAIQRKLQGNNLIDIINPRAIQNLKCKM